MKIKNSKLFAIAYIAVAFFCIASLLNYILVDDTYQTARLMMHDFYTQKNIDVLCVGPSHFYRGLDPEIINKATGKNVFIASSSNQYPDASFALIKEAIKLYDVEQVFLEVSASVALETGQFKDRDSLVSTYLVSDYMKPSLNKLQFLLNASSNSHYMNSFWKARRSYKNILDFNYIINLIQRKNSSNYRDYVAEKAKGDIGWYAEKGYVPTTKSVDEHLFYSKLEYDQIDTNMISNDWKRTVDSIIEYCNKHGIKITLVNVPVSNFKLAVYGNYDKYIDFIKNFIDGKNVSYVDFNLVKEDVFCYKQGNYLDQDHYNINGAEMFSNLFSDYLNNNTEKNIFYNSVKEKLNDIEPYYYGIAYREIREQNVQIIKMVSNISNYFEFKVEVLKDNGSSILLQDFSINDEVSVPLNFIETESGISGSLAVSFRKRGSKEATRVIYNNH